MQRHLSSEFIQQLLSDQKPKKLFKLIVNNSLAEIDKALLYSLSSDREQPEQIHQIRLTLKRLRAYWRLIRPVVDKQVYRQANKRLCATAKMLANCRDQYVLLNSLHEISSGLKKGQQRKLEARVLEQFSADGSADSAAIDWNSISQSLQREHLQWQNLQSVHASRSKLPKGLLQTYQRFVNWANKSKSKKVNYPHRHEWRKWSKHLLYQLRVLKRCGLQIPKKQMKSLNRLEDLLGNEHDLVNLLLFLNEQHARSSLNDKLYQAASSAINQQLESVYQQSKAVAKLLK